MVAVRDERIQPRSHLIAVTATLDALYPQRQTLERPKVEYRLLGVFRAARLKIACHPEHAHAGTSGLMRLDPPHYEVLQ